MENLPVPPRLPSAWGSPVAKSASGAVASCQGECRDGATAHPKFQPVGKCSCRKIFLEEASA